MQSNVIDLDSVDDDLIIRLKGKEYKGMMPTMKQVKALDSIEDENTDAILDFFVSLVPDLTREQLEDMSIKRFAKMANDFKKMLTANPSEAD